MSTPHSQHIPQEPSRLNARGLMIGGLVVGLVGFGVSLVAGYAGEMRRFLFAWLVGVAFFLAIGMGAMLFVLVQHLTRAGWSVNVRRVAESMAMTIPVVGLLTLPILISIAVQHGTLYPWAVPAKEHHAQEKAGKKEHGPGADDAKYSRTAAARPAPSAAAAHAIHAKRAWLNPWFVIVRLVFYFAVWTLIARYYWVHSTRQDLDGDVGHTMLMQKYAGVSILVAGITVTFASFDLLMSLDPQWYSTIFGVYFISASVMSFFAATILIIRLLQARGHLKVVGVDHFHDLGKFMFGFVFFWGYIAFSQYMLLWYANIPETTEWLSRRGGSGVNNMALATKGQMAQVPDHGNTWRGVAIALLLGHLLIPFAGLLSRHVKRNTGAVTFWAVWLLVFHFVDMYWIVLPEMRMGFAPHWIDIVCWLGVGGLVVAAWARIAGSQKLRPINDPRMEESLVFQNI